MNKFQILRLLVALSNTVLKHFVGFHHHDKSRRDSEVGQQRSLNVACTGAGGMLLLLRG